MRSAVDIEISALACRANGESPEAKPPSPSKIGVCCVAIRTSAHTAQSTHPLSSSVVAKDRGGCFSNSGVGTGGLGGGRLRLLGWAMVSTRTTGTRPTTMSRLHGAQAGSRRLKQAASRGHALCVQQQGDSGKRGIHRRPLCIPRLPFIIQDRLCVSPNIPLSWLIPLSVSPVEKWIPSWCHCAGQT